MNFFDNCEPFLLKIYLHEDDWNVQNESHIFPVFYHLPTQKISQSFGLCVSQVDDIKKAQSFFTSQSLDSSQTHFLYVMGDACRQTDTLEAASRTPYPIILEKGPFLSPDDVKRMVAKLSHKNFALVECGSSFGYADRVLDPRSLCALKEASKYFGICVSDLLSPNAEVYPHRSTWLSNEKFLTAFDSSAKHLKPNFYVYKSENLSSLSSPADSMSSRDLIAGSSSSAYRGGWDGHITSTVKLSREHLTVIAGPCMLESLELGLQVGKFLKELCHELGYQYVFKSSFDKANRTSAGGIRGPGLSQGLKWLAQIKQELDVPILTDVHNAEQAYEMSEVADILQIPAFLFRERSLLLAAAKTGKVLQIKKGQWASAQDMVNVASFLATYNCHNVILAERGSCFGYNNLVVDFRNLVDMASLNNAVVFDATHAVQLPGAKDGKSSGLRHMVPALTRAALAVGIDGLFMEVHPNPVAAWSDADTQLSFDMVRDILSAHAQSKQLTSSRV